MVICVCTCRRPVALERLLDSLVNLRLDRLAVDSVELIVIDNRPDGVARQLCASASCRLPIELHFAEEPEPGISHARNRAVDVALERGADLVSFIDDDDVPEPDWLCHLIRKQEQTGADLVFGRWSFAAGSDVPAWIRDQPQFRSSDYDKRDIYALPPWASTCNVIIGSRLLRKMKDQGAAFSPDFAFLGGEDKDFFIRALARGASYATSARSMVVRHDVEARFTTMGILRRSFRRGCSKIHIMKKHRPRSELRRLIRQACGKLIVTALSLPLHIFSAGRMVRQLAKVSKDTGIIYGYFGWRYKYYKRR
jgi:GT2 family glycosyltransferase